MPMYRRLPKRGFHNPEKVAAQPVNLKDLTRVSVAEINPDTLTTAGLITRPTTKVKILGKETCTTKTEISMSSGDEAGTAGGGMVSSKIKGPALSKKGSDKVKVEGAPIVHLTSMVALNGGSNANTPPGNQVAPSQTKVTVKP